MKLPEELFTSEQVIPKSYLQDYTNKILIIKPSWFKPEYRSPKNQLFLAECGFGCDPSKMGTAVYGQFLIDGERTRIERFDFLGIIADEFVPKWAKEKVNELKNKNN